MKKILIVEDEKNIVLTLKMLLAKAGYCIETAKNGTDAVKIAQKVIPDIILLDIVIPQMNGYIVLEAIKQNNDTKNIPVIIISAKNQEEDIKKAFSLGANDYLVKPFSYEQVKSTINNYLKED